MPERDPQGRGIDRQREREMRDEPVLADLDPVGKAALDHVPAERALQKPSSKMPASGGTADAAAAAAPGTR